MSESRFELQPQSWYKRRMPHQAPDVVDFKVSGFQKCENAFCTLEIRMSNGETHQLDGRIYQLDNGVWKVHGLNPHGLSVLLKLIE